MGSDIGERLVERVSRDTPRFKNELDAVIFICKSFWTHAFNKQVDNLKTNHQVRMVGGVAVVSVDHLPIHVHTPEFTAEESVGWWLGNMIFCLIPTSPTLSL